MRDIQRKMPDRRYLLFIFVLAVTARTAFLFFNEAYLDFEPFWSAQARYAIVLALSNLGDTALNPAVETYFDATVADALKTWPLMDRGIVFIHLVIEWFFGATSYLALQTLQLIIDALMVFPIMGLAARAGGRSAATAAGIFYAVFVPQIWVASMPDYNVWLTFGFICLTWLFVKFVEDDVRTLPITNYLLFGFVIFIVATGVNQIRSIIVLFPIAMAGWYGLSEVITRRSFRFPAVSWARIATLLVAGIMVIVTGGAINKAVRGEASPVRSTFGHSFWAGVGQFENPYGVIEDDGSIAQFFFRETGIKDTGDTGGVEYNAWLTKRGIQFIEEYPGLYASMVARRALRIIIPNMPFTMVADKPAYDRLPIEKQRVRERQELQGKFGKVSPTTISRLWASDPEYVVGLFIRIFLMVFLPQGLFAYFVFAKDRRLGMWLALPLAYTVITLSPFFTQPVILVMVYAAVIPAVMAGWVLVFQRLFDLTARLRGTKQSI